MLAFQRGEEVGFNYFFFRHYTALCLFSYTITRYKEISEEIAGDVFLKLWERHEDFFNASAIRSFLFRSVKNASLNWLRQQKRENLQLGQLTYLSEQAEAHILQKIIAAELYAEIYAALETLPPQCRRIFQMLFIEGKNYQQISAELRLSVSTIRNQKARAIMLLKKQLNPAIISLLYFFCINF